MPSPHFLTDPAAPPHRIPMDDLLADCGSSDAFTAAEARLVIRACMVELTVSDRFLAELRFFHGWTLFEVAQLDGRTELELSRAFARILELLRVRLGASPAPDRTDRLVDVQVGDIA